MARQTQACRTCHQRGHNSRTCNAAVVQDDADDASNMPTVASHRPTVASHRSTAPPASAAVHRGHVPSSAEAHAALMATTHSSVLVPMLHAMADQGGDKPPPRHEDYMERWRTIRQRMLEGDFVPDALLAGFRRSITRRHLLILFEHDGYVKASLQDEAFTSEGNMACYHVHLSSAIGALATHQRDPIPKSVDGSSNLVLQAELHESPVHTPLVWRALKEGEGGNDSDTGIIYCSSHDDSQPESRSLSQLSVSAPPQLAALPSTHSSLSASSSSTSSTGPLCVSDSVSDDDSSEVVVVEETDTSANEAERAASRSSHSAGSHSAAAPAAPTHCPASAAAKPASPSASLAAGATATMLLSPASPDPVPQQHISVAVATEGGVATVLKAGEGVTPESTPIPAAQHQ
jgi:hypothetical protein